MTQTIAIVNEKGGTGKTTTAVNLAAALGEQGRQILLVDLDGQAASSRWLGVEDDTRFADALWRGEAFEPIPHVMRGVALAPGSGKLDSVAHDLRPTQGGQLRRVLGLLDGFDTIIIDCPPSLGNRLIGNALLAATHAIVPVEASILALDGLRILLTTFQDVRDGFGHEIILRGVLACRFDARTKLSRLVLAELNRALPGRVFRTVIRENVRMRECPGSGKSILEYAPDSHAAEDYRALAKELLAAPLEMPGLVNATGAPLSEGELTREERQAILNLRGQVNSMLRAAESSPTAVAQTTPAETAEAPCGLDAAPLATEAADPTTQATAPVAEPAAEPVQAEAPQPVAEAAPVSELAAAHSIDNASAVPAVTAQEPASDAVAEVAAPAAANPVVIEEPAAETPLPASAPPADAPKAAEGPAPSEFVPAGVMIATQVEGDTSPTPVEEPAPAEEVWAKGLSQQAEKVGPVVGEGSEDPAVRATMPGPAPVAQHSAPPQPVKVMEDLPEGPPADPSKDEFAALRAVLQRMKSDGTPETAPQEEAKEENKGPIWRRIFSKRSA